MDSARDHEPSLVGSIPWRIESDWGPLAAVLAGFPVSLLYAAVHDAGGAPAVAVCSYWFDPGTYTEDAAHREMWYRPRHASPYRVCVTCATRTGRWQTTKYRGAAIVARAEGPSLERAMMQTTVSGLVADKRQATAR